MASRRSPAVSSGRSESTRRMTREKNSLAVDQLAELITLRLEMGMRQFIFRPRGLSGHRGMQDSTDDPFCSLNTLHG